MPARSFVAGIGVLLHFCFCLYFRLEFNDAVIFHGFLFFHNFFLCDFFFHDDRRLIHYGVFFLYGFNRSSVAPGE